ncbi:hypothetical protein JQC67_11120 [Aurantibacter crassamenti]|uniref:HNH endonuclease n=1 Tax=Aurantibacter crassamenti TaxID=1837375 RepID=UPI001939E22A|nr:HNH endonuclease [Aurantibacter crassamenti]MBM1106690.1 hypothetical protein [Aurantibacter crassamenti]
MAVYNTTSDSANTAVRALLTKIGEYYLKKSFNTGSGKGKKDWEKIRDIYFYGKCSYCERGDLKLQVEHLIMFNRTEYGLHHPGNIAPVCNDCNKRRKSENKNYLDWEGQLKQICKERNELDLFHTRKKRILYHMNESEYKYPNLTDAEKHAIRVIANSLYENIKTESEKSLNLYKELDEAFVNNNKL